MSFNDDFETGDGYNGIQESPLPNTTPVQTNHGVQDPNVTVKRPDVTPSRNYNSQAQGGARQGRTEEVMQGYAQPGQTVIRQQQSQQQTQQSNQIPTQQPIQKSKQSKFGKNKMQNEQQMQTQMHQQVPTQSTQQVNMQQMTQEQHQQLHQQQMQTQMMQQQAYAQQQIYQNQAMQGQVASNQIQRPQRQKKPIGKKLLIILAVVLLATIGVVVVKTLTKKPVAQEQVYETSGKYALDSLQNALNNYDATTIDSLVGIEDGDSYIAQEWAYVNRVKIREEFIQKICALVTFSYPQVQQLSTEGEVMINADGSPIMIESYMNNGEAVIVTIPDYNKIAQTMDEDYNSIIKMFKSSKYTPEDYTWNDEMANLMLQYIMDEASFTSIPTKQVEMNLEIRLNTEGKPYIVNDAVLDDALFGSEDFHYMCAKFSQLCVGWTGYKDEHYTVQELQHNPEYDDWFKLFIKYFEADGGIYDSATGEFKNVQKAFDKRKSKWEPWYLRDDNNVVQKHEDGTYIVNYFSVKDENGNDWIQPDEEIMVEVDKVRQIEDPWIEETGIMYNWIGQNFIQNVYQGLGDTRVRVGDGSREYPAGIGTTLITKALCNDGKFHDVRVALVGYWTDQHAIDYAEKFSTKNRGFTTSSVVQLICYEVSIENLEDEAITFEASEMTLADRNTNISSRTGTMYGFSETVTIQPGETIIINDWATSTELSQKYVCWGKNFGRQFSILFFDALAGTGDIPSYSAYEQFTGKSSIDESIDTSSN